MFAKLSRTPSLTLHIEVSKGTWQGTLGSSQNSLCGNCTFRFDVASKNEAPDACWEPKIVFFELVRSWSLAIGRRSAGPVAFACIDREFCGHFAVRTKLKDSCPAQLPWNGTKQKVFCNLLAKYPSDPTVRYSIPGLKQLIKFQYIQSMWWTLDIYIYTYRSIQYLKKIHVNIQIHELALLLQTNSDTWPTWPGFPSIAPLGQIYS